MWASNDKDSCCPYQGMFFVPGKPPVGESNGPRYDCNIEKDCGCTVSKGLGARSGSLRRSNKAHDPGQSGPLPDCRNAYPKASATDDRSRDDHGTWPLRDPLGFAGNHRLVDIGGALDDYAIRRDTGSGPDQDDVAYAQLRERNGLNFRTVYPFGSVWEKRS